MAGHTHRSDADFADFWRIQCSSDSSRLPASLWTHFWGLISRSVVRSQKVSHGEDRLRCVGRWAPSRSQHWINVFVSSNVDPTFTAVSTTADFILSILGDTLQLLAHTQLPLIYTLHLHRISPRLGLCPVANFVAVSLTVLYLHSNRILTGSAFSIVLVPIPQAPIFVAGTARPSDLVVKKVLPFDLPPTSLALVAQLHTHILLLT